MRRIWFLLLGFLALAGTAPAAMAAAPSPLTVTAQDRILGKPDAPVTIIEYASLNCPHCAHFTLEVLPTLKKQWIDTGKARLIVRDFPLNGEALRAAMVARCAPAAQFYPLIDTFFEEQPSWVDQPDYLKTLARLAKLGGMSQQKFDQCVSDKKLEDAIVGSRLVAAQQLGVNATPTFFINGSKFDGDPTVAAFDQLLSHLTGKS